MGGISRLRHFSIDIPQRLEGFLGLWNGEGQVVFSRSGEDFVFETNSGGYFADVERF